MTDAFDVGDLKRLTAAVLNVAGAAADPTELTLYIREPDWTLQTYTWVVGAEIVKDSLGNFHYDYTITKAGQHVASWAATGAVVEAETKEFFGRARVAAA